MCCEWATIFTTDKYDWSKGDVKMDKVFLNDYCLLPRLQKSVYCAATESIVIVVTLHGFSKNLNMRETSGRTTCYVFKVFLSHKSSCNLFIKCLCCFMLAYKTAIVQTFFAMFPTYTITPPNTKNQVINNDIILINIRDTESIDANVLTFGAGECHKISKKKKKQRPTTSKAMYTRYQNVIKYPVGRKYGQQIGHNESIMARTLLFRFHPCKLT